MPDNDTEAATSSANFSWKSAEASLLRRVVHDYKPVLRTQQPASAQMAVNPLTGREVAIDRSINTELQHELRVERRRPAFTEQRRGSVTSGLEMEAALKRFAAQRTDIFDGEGRATLPAPHTRCWDGHTQGAGQSAMLAEGQRRAKAQLENVQHARLAEVEPAAPWADDPRSGASSSGQLADAVRHTEETTARRSDAVWRVAATREGHQSEAVSLFATLSAARPKLSIGRHAQNGLQIDVLEISKRHAKLLLKHGIVFIKDCGSTHGTWLNGRRLTEVEGLQPIPSGGRRLLSQTGLPDRAQPHPRLAFPDLTAALASAVGRRIPFLTRHSPTLTYL